MTSFAIVVQEHTDSLGQKDYFVKLLPEVKQTGEILVDDEDNVIGYRQIVEATAHPETQKIMHTFPGLALAGDGIAEDYREIFAALRIMMRGSA